MDLKSIRQNVFNYLAKQSNNVLLNDCITLIMAEIIGTINSKNADDYGKWKSFCFGVKDYKNLTKEGLFQKIEFEILSSMTINMKLELIEYKPKIYNLDDEYLTFEEGIYDFYKNANVNLRTNYGDKPYTPKLESGKPKLEKNSTLNTTLIPNLNKVLSEEEADLNIFWKKIESEERKGLFPFWKWKINSTEYNELEAKLKAVLAKYKQKDVIERLSFKIALYYAEWYKRKYIGNNSKIDNILDIKPEAIWSNIHEKYKSKYLYTINKSERRDDSLRLLGGLPLTYITTDEKSSNLSLKFSKLFKAINSGKTLNVEDLGLNNQSMNKSVQNGGSIYEFIEELLNEKFPFAESDMELSPFKEFKSFVEGGLKQYKEEKKKKFSVNWLVEQHSTFEFIYPYLQIKLKPSKKDETHRFISKERLLNWGVENCITYFEIIVRIIFEEGEKVFNGNYFNLCANNKFISRNGDTWKIPLGNLPKKPLSIEFILKTEDKVKSIQKEEIPRYIQLWNVEYGVWQNKAKNGKQSAVLFLSENTFTKESEQSKSFYTKNNINNYRWAAINKELIIIDNDNEKKLFQMDGGIEVTPKNLKPFSNAIKYYEDGKVKFIQNECESYVYLLKGKIEFEVNYIPTSIFRVKNTTDKKREFEVEYKTPTMNNFDIYDIKTILTQGFVKFRIVSDPYSEIVECYWLPQNAIINRDVFSQRITFKEIEMIELSNNSYLDKDDNIDDNYLIFKIGDEDAYLELKIYRALNRPNDLLIDGKYETSKDVIPIRFADKFTIRVIDQNGLQLHKLSDEIDKYQKARVVNNNCNLIEDSTGVKHGSTVLKTFTKDFKQYKGFYYFFDSARKTIDDYEKNKLYFLSLDTNKIERIYFCIEKDGNNIDYVGFRLKRETDGIVFQSLNTDIYQETYRPFFASTNENKFHSEVKKNDRGERIKKFKENFDFDLAIKHFNIAVEYNLYFGMFDILLALEDNPILLAEFYLKYCTEMKSSCINYNELLRFAEEMLFDWMLIPRKVWIDAIDNRAKAEKQKWILTLFKQKNISTGQEIYSLNQCCDSYWKSELNYINNTNILYKNIKRKTKVNDFFKSSINEKIDTLKKINASTDIYTSLSTSL